VATALWAQRSEPGPASWELGLAAAAGRTKRPLWRTVAAQAAAQQRRLVDAAVALLRPGGTLVYSTCTLNPGAANWLFYIFKNL